MLDTLPEHIRDAAKAILQPGEVVRWAEAWEIPRMRADFTISLVVTTIGLVLVLWLAGVLPKYSSGANAATVFGIVVTGIGILIFTNATSTLKRAQNSAWLITDRRVIDLEARMVGGPNAISYEPNVIAPREKRVTLNGSGYLAFLGVVTDTDDGVRFGHIGMDVRDLPGAEAAMELLLPRGGCKANGAPISESAALSSAEWAASGPALRAAIDAELRIGEQVYWFGLPIPENIVDNAFAVIMLVLFLSIPVSLMLLSEWAFIVFAMLLVSFIALLVYAGRRYVSDGADKAYIITSIRAIEVTAGRNGGRTVVSVFPHEFNIRKKSLRFDGVGCLFFLHETARGKKGETASQTVGFKRIRDVAGAEKALDRLARSAANAGSASAAPHPVGTTE